MSKHPAIEQLVTDYRQSKSLRAGSLIISLFGDAISSHGGQVWLGSLIKVLAPFGINERLVRTSVYRLGQEGWLDSSQIGRRSFYRFTEFGLQQYQKAARRIYALTPLHWDEKWTLLFPLNNLGELRDEAVKELQWLGFGSLFANMMARPGTEQQSLNELLQELGVANKLAVMQAQSQDLGSTDVLKQLAHKCWDLSTLEQRYRAFLDKFRPIYHQLSSHADFDAEQCFQLRLLLIHEYRRMLLKDTELPAQLLPNDWAGNAASNLVANLYKLTQGPAETYLLAQMQTAEGPLPPASGHYFERFGGLN